MNVVTGWPATAAISFLAAALTWRWQAWKPVHAGLSSWQAGLTLAFLHHLQWGPQVVFTFGPYGFLEDALPFARLTAALGLVYGFALRWGLAALIVAGLRRSWGVLAAGALAWLAVGVAANLTEAPELATAVGLGLLLAVLDADGPGGRRLVLLGLLGGLAGLQMLVEINTGLVCTGLAALAVVAGVGAPRQLSTPAGAGAANVSTPAEAGAGGAGWAAGAVAAGAAPFVGVPVALLGAGGQRLSNLASYLRSSASVALGYTPAMSLSGGRRAEDWLALVDLALLATAFALGLRRRARREKLAISLALAGWTWELAKEGFVRHDLHDLTFFGLVVAAIALARLPRWFAWQQAGAVFMGAVLACLANGGVPLSLRSPVESAGALAGEVGDVASAHSWAGVAKVAKRQAERTGDALPGRLLDALATHSFAVEPVEDSMSFAFPALRHWDPEPVLQAYSAYTPYLDHLDTAFLTSGRAPELILYRPVSTSGQDPAWEPPAATEAMYCRYKEAMTADYWVLLRRVGDRCRRPRLLGRAVAHFGQVLVVPPAPAPDDMVVARFSISLPAWNGFEDALWKAPAVYAKTWSRAGPAGGGTGAGGSGGAVARTWRFVTATAGDDHVLSVPPTSGWTKGYGPAEVRRVEFSGGGWPAGGTVRVTFYSVRLSD